MRELLNESAIVRALAGAVVERITRRVIRDLQRMDVTLSGEDSGLKSPWDELCAQVQYMESFYWDAYEETVRAIVDGYVKDLPKYETEAIWLQTEEGFDWALKEPEDREPYPVFRGDIVEYVMREGVYLKAGQWSNARIRAYIDRG